MHIFSYITVAVEIYHTMPKIDTIYALGEMEFPLDTFGTFIVDWHAWQCWHYGHWIKKDVSDTSTNIFLNSLSLKYMFLIHGWHFVTLLLTNQITEWICKIEDFFEMHSGFSWDCKIAKLQNCKIVEKPLLKCISGSLIAVTLMAKRASWDLFQKLSSNKSKSDESNPLLQHSNQLRCHSFTDNQCNPTQFENWIIHALLVVIFAAKNVISYVFCMILMIRELLWGVV